MDLQFEKIQPDAHSSFRLLTDSRLNDFFYWHVHPEWELVYIEGADGTRHVGEHISRYQGSDLVFIGSNIPHVNFDYRVRTAYEQVVLHLRPDFLQQARETTPELRQIQSLFEQARLGVAFDERIKAVVGPRLKRLASLSHFEQFLEILHLFQLLAQAPQPQYLHSRPPINSPNQKDQARMRRLYQFIDAHYQRKITLEEVARYSHLSRAAFCRYFKKMTRLTFTQFLNHYRIEQAKKRLLLDQRVSEACFACGFESLSYFNRMFRRVTGENPMAFKQRHLAGM